MRTRKRKLCRGQKVLVRMDSAPWFNEAPPVGTGLWRLRLVRLHGGWYGANRGHGPVAMIMLEDEGVAWARGWTGEAARALQASAALS